MTTVLEWRDRTESWLRWTLDEQGVPLRAERVSVLSVPPPTWVQLRWGGPWNRP